MKQLKFKPKAVIFDMDGVIIDSMPYHFLAWYETLRPLGLAVSCYDIYSKEGERWDKTLKDFLRKAGIKPTKEALEKVFAARQKIFSKNFKRVIFKGAPELLACLKRKGYALGLVTGTPAYQIPDILPKKIRAFFDHIVSGDEVKKGKPDPEPYLKAAKALGAKPSECVVVENAPFGVRSAKGAGMFCVALTTSLPRKYLKGADIIADRLEDVSGIIDSSCGVR